MNEQMADKQSLSARFPCVPVPAVIELVDEILPTEMIPLDRCALLIATTPPQIASRMERQINGAG